VVVTAGEFITITDKCRTTVDAFLQFHMLMDDSEEETLVYAGGRPWFYRNDFRSCGPYSYAALDNGSGDIALLGPLCFR
jgi:hypothetical protein